MEDIKNFMEKFEAMTSEEKQNFIQNLVFQNQQLNNKLVQIQDQLVFRRLDYLFKITESLSFDSDFQDKCKKEIELIMFGNPEESKDVADAAEPEKESK